MTKLRRRLVVATVSILLRVPVFGGSPTPLFHNNAHREIELGHIPSSLAANIDPAEPESVENIENFRRLEKTIYALAGWENQVLGKESQSQEDTQSISHGLPVSPVSEGPVLFEIHDESLPRKGDRHLEVPQLQAAAAVSIIKRTRALQALHEGRVGEAQEQLMDVRKLQDKLDRHKSQYPGMISTLYQAEICQKWLDRWEEMRKNYKGLLTEAELSRELQQLATERRQLEWAQTHEWGATLMAFAKPHRINKVRSVGEPGERQYTAVDFAIRALRHEAFANASLRSGDLLAALQSLRSAQKAQEESKRARDAWVAENKENFSLMEYKTYKIEKNRYTPNTPSRLSKIKAWLGSTSKSLEEGTTTT